LQICQHRVLLIGMIPSANEKRELYADLRLKLQGVCEGEKDLIAKMASAVCLLHETMPHYFWTGFYRVVGSSLVIGPYQGSLGCLRIAWGRGVCGAAWSSGQTQLVADVHEFPGHIACDARSESEIVVPLKNARGEVIAVLDIDAEEKNAFCEVDQQELESLLASLVS
jgi:L-methionine (R)-S-oxide reductase